MNEDIVQIKNHDPSQSLFQDIKNLIETGRSKVAVTVNKALTLLYWQVGQRIHKEILVHERAEYGKQILQTLAAKLTEGGCLILAPKNPDPGDRYENWR
jgi:hypothetical protein